MHSGTVAIGLPRRVARYGPDIVLAIGLAVAAYMVRRGGSAADGFFYDDAWVAFGAVKGSITDIPMTGGAHPGYTLLLWAQERIVGGNVARLVISTFVFGVVGPAVVFGCLRALRYERASSFLAAAALVVTPSHVTYSGRLKSYTIDLVLVMVLATLLPRLSERRWTWAGAGAWVAVTLAAGSISGYVMLATAVATGILVLHPNADRWPRVAALAVQGLCQGGWVLYTRRFVDMDEIEAFMESGYDAHVERSANPLELGQNLLRHLERVVDGHPGAPSGLLGIVAVAVLAGLVLGAVGRLDRPRAVVSRFALTALTLAAIGGLLDRFPFGPRNFDLGTVLGAPGARHSLWLVPITAIGLCNLIDLLVRFAGSRPVAAGALRVAVVLGSVLLVSSRWNPADPYPGPGRRHLASVVERAVDDGAFVVLDEQVSYQLLVYSDRPVRLASTPDEMVGFVPQLDLAEGVVLDGALTAAEVRRIAAETRHDLMVVSGYDPPYSGSDVFYGDELLEAGWNRQETEVVAGVRVTVWQVPATT